MAGILNFNQYIGGPDQIKIEQAFPSDQKTFLYNFGRDLTGWTITAEFQTLVVDQMAFNRNTGQPNFSTSTVIGSFPAQTLDGAYAPSIIDEGNGMVKVIIPANMYTGAIVPDARANVPIVIVSITWADNSTPAQINTHRWALIQCWEPGVVVGDPTAEVDYTSMALGV